MTEGGFPPGNRRVVAVLAWCLIAALALFTSTSADESPTAGITLESGQTALTWSGAEPYAIANFQGTPVTQIHRWDAVSQRWLSHFVGQDDATLPERHLLPRVQYLLASDKAHKLTIPNPIAGIDPRADLQMPAAPDDPLRFEAYWPNEDSPLEDLILLRPDDERLSVEAWVAGGVGEIEVYWFLDGRLNHQGAESDDVELLPGKHDDARLFAADEMGQVISVGLPRVVKLPKADIPEMTYGIVDISLAGEVGGFDWIGSLGRGHWDDPEQYEAALRTMAELGFGWWRADWRMNQVYGWSPNSEADLSHLDWVFQLADEAGLKQMHSIGMWIVPWLTSSDIHCMQDERPRSSCDSGIVRDLRDFEEYGRFVAARWPEIDAYKVGSEPNLQIYRVGQDPYREVLAEKALALGIWYENPNALIVAANTCCFWGEEGWFEYRDDGLSSSRGKWIGGLRFLEAMYEAGLGPYHDIVGLHPTGGFPAVVEEFDQLRALMLRYGDGEKPMWASESHHWTNPLDSEARARGNIELARFYTERDDISGVFFWKFRDDPREVTAFFHGEEEDDWATGIVEWEFRDGAYRLKPEAIALRDFLQRQRESSEE